MTKAISLLLLLWCGFLTGCAFNGLRDPFGAYEARIAVEDRRAAAQETIARYDRDARMAEAENAAWAKVGAARAWAHALPTVAFLIGASVVVVVYIRWSGRITLAKIKHGLLIAPTRPPQRVGPQLSDLQLLAARRNQQIKVINGVALLVDKESGQVVKRRRLLEQ